MGYKCCICGRPATVAVKETHNGIVTVKYYCDECSPMDSMPSMSKLLSSMFGQETRPRSRSMRVCKCGMTERDVMTTGKFGCSECYDTFRDIADNYLRSRGYRTHRGKVPIKYARGRSEIDLLQAQLDKAVADRDYMQAARLDEQISKLKNKNGKKEG